MVTAFPLFFKDGHREVKNWFILENYTFCYQESGKKRGKTAQKIYSNNNCRFVSKKERKIGKRDVFLKAKELLGQKQQFIL